MGVVELKIDVSGIEAMLAQISRITQSDETMTEVHQLVAELADPYVPYRTGALANNIDITPDGVVYHQPYAEEVYTEDVPHNPAHHPLATDHWGEAMMRDRGDELSAGISEILTRKLNERIG